MISSLTTTIFTPRNAEQQEINPVVAVSEERPQTEMLPRVHDYLLLPDPIATRIRITMITPAPLIGIAEDANK
jgi:hypothetical protein